jgi:hypothetical protein
MDPELLLSVGRLAKRKQPFHLVVEDDGFRVELRAAAAVGPPPAGTFSTGPLGRDPRLPKWVKDESLPAHLSQFEMVYWPGLGVFTLTPKQALVVKRLWTAWDEGLPGVKQQLLLEAADSDGTRVIDLFRRSDAWGKLIVAGPVPGTFTLPPLDPPVEPDSEAAAYSQSAVPTWAADAELPAHLSEFQMVYWPRCGVFRLTPMQALVVEELWRAWEDGRPEVEERRLLDAADSSLNKLFQLFRRSDAWGKLVVKGRTPNHFTLPPATRPCDVDPFPEPDQDLDDQ